MPDGMSLEQWRAKKAQAKPSGGMSLDQWRAAKTAPVAPAPVAPPAPPAPNFVRMGGGGFNPSAAQFQNVPKRPNWLRDSPMVGPTVRMGEVIYHGIADPIAGAIDAASANYERDWRAEEFRKNHPELANQPSMSAPSSAADFAGIVGKGTFGTTMGVAQVAEPWMLPLVASQAAAQKQAEDEATMQGAHPALGVAAAPAKALEWWATENAAPFAEKAGVVAHDITGSPTVAKGVEGVTDFAANMIPFEAAGLGRRAVTSIGKPARPTMPPLERVPVPEQIPGTPSGRLSAARPAPVAEPVAPAMRPVPPNVTGTTGVRAASPEMAAELRLANTPTPAIPAPAPVVETVPGRLRASKPAPIELEPPVDVSQMRKRAPAPDVKAPAKNVARTPAEHIAAVEDLRRRYNGALSRRDAERALAAMDARASDASKVNLTAEELAAAGDDVWAGADVPKTMAMKPIVPDGAPRARLASASEPGSSGRVAPVEAPVNRLRKRAVAEPAPEPVPPAVEAPAPVAAQPRTTRSSSHPKPWELVNRDEFRAYLETLISEGMTREDAWSKAVAERKAYGDELLQQDGAILTDADGGRVRVRHEASQRGGPKDRIVLEVLDENSNVVNVRSGDPMDAASYQRAPAPDPVKPAPVAEVAPKQPEPAQAPPASEKVPTISDKAAPTPEPTSLWREMHPDEALSVVDPSVSVGRGMSNVPPERFVATDRSLALGQGANAGGVVVEFDPAGMNVRTPKARKPGADFVESTGGGGERILVGDEGTIRPNVRSVTVPRGKVRSGAQVRMTRMLERDGWTKEVNADKTVTYRRPAVEAKPASPELPPPAEPAPAPKVEAPAPASVPEIPETSAPAPSPQRAFIDRFVQATREGKTEDAAAEYRAMPLTERAKIFDAFVADGLFKRGDGWGLPAIKAHADRVVAAEKAAEPAPAKPYGVNKGKLRRGGKQSGEIVNPIAASESVYDAADAAGGKLLRSAASAVRENVPGVDKVVTAAEGIRDKWFKSDAANVGPEYLAAKGERRGVEGLGVEHAGRAVKAVDKALRKATPEEIEGSYRYLIGQSDALPANLVHRKALFDAVAREIKDLGAEQVERGLMSQEAFDQYVRYLPRLYETKGKLFGGGSDAPRIRESFLREDAPGFKFKAGDYAIIEETARKHGGYAFTEKHGTRAVKFPTVEARDAAYNEVSDAFRGQKSRLNQQATGEIRKGEVGQAKMLHRDSLETPSASRMIEKFDAIKPEVLKELGEITDPRAPIQQAIQNAHAKIAADTFFKAVAEGSDAKGPWAVELPRDGYTHIDAQWAGKLRGKYVRNDILPDIQGDFNADKAGFARGWINQWKANKTVWSPRTAARQWFGNPFFMHIAGVDPMNPANWNAIKKAATALHPDSPLRRELVREGAIGPHDFAHIELPTDRAPNMAYRLGQAAANPLMLFRFGRNSQMRMGKVYGSADLVARASIYFRNLERGMSPRQAAAEVRKWTPNYDEVGRATKLLKNSVIGSPFATYSHETLRIVGQALKDHPVRLGTGLLTLAAVQKAFDMAGADEVTEDERKAIEQQRGSQELIIGRDSDGRPLTFGAQYINPIGSLAPKASRLGDDALTNAATYVGDVTGVAQSPLVDTLATMSRGEDRYGRKTSPRAATGYERVMGALEAYGRQVAPGLTPGLGGNYAQLEAAAKGEQLSDRIPKQTLQQAIVSAILGIDVRPFDVGLEKKNLSKQMEGRISSIESDRNTALRESKGKDKDAAPTAVEKMKDTVQDFRERSGVLRKASPPKKDTLPSPQEKP